MSNSIKIMGKRIGAILVCVSLMLPTACGKSNEQVTTVSESTEASYFETVSVSEETSDVPAKIDDNGKPIWDFDEFVNAEWKKGQEGKLKQTGAAYTCASYDNQPIIKERLIDILENTDISGLSADDDMYKAVTLYRQIMNYGDRDTRIKTIKKYLEPIDKVKNLYGLYEYFKTPESVIFNRVLALEVNTDENGYYSLYYMPEDFSATIARYTAMVDAEPEDSMGRIFLSFMEELGYSESRTREILKNSATVADIITTYHSSTENDGLLYYYDADKFEKKGVSLPLFEILKAQGLGGNVNRILAEKSIATFLNNLFVAENAEALRDYTLFTTITTLCPIAIYDATETSTEAYREFAYYITSVSFMECLLTEYITRYYGEKAKDDIANITHEVIGEAKELVNSIEWLGTADKEAAKRKIWVMNEAIGELEVYNDLSDVTLGDNVVDNYIAVLTDRMRFNYEQTLTEDDDRKLYRGNVFDIDARSYPELNVIYVSIGMLDHVADDNMPYEEKLARYGECLAHEISHTYDTMHIDYGAHGIYEPWMSDAGRAEYDSRIQSIKEFFDGYEVEYGGKVDGDRVKSETLADLMAVQICLNILETHENPDYDAFFRAYAYDKAMYFEEAGLQAVLNDEHLPGKARINGVLGQFDKFYEVYDIDESSPYYVPKDNRIKMFWE
ncbi:MAG: hypothetical protein IK018_09825 [Lachnospiraceae bacterium]|nr:hypothetical protein [Lachnospiraceae bacterium]